MRLGELQLALAVALAAPLAAAPLFAQNEFNQGQGTAVVTVLPAHQAPAPAIAESQLALKIDGKAATISRWERLENSNAPIQFVVLIDDGAGGSLGNQLGDIAQFINSLPSSAEAGVAYMRNGRADFAGPLSKDHAAVAKQLRVPSGSPGISGSPYFCLSDLAHHWPSQDRTARRVALLITDGVDNYDVRYNPDDPYVQAAIHDSIRSRISVYSIYWRSSGAFNRGWYAANDGQSLLSQLTSASGGYSYWQGAGNPVSLQPYLKDLADRLDHQYGLTFTVPMPKGPGVESMQLQASGTSAKLVVPQQVYVGHPAAAEPGQ